MSHSLPARVVPPPVLAGGGAGKLLERNWLVYRRIWVVIFSGFFEPLFYLFSIGVGIGALVGEIIGPDGVPVDYTAYVAPALLAASAMNGAIYESTFNIFFKLKYGKVYEAILATPMKPSDIAIGEITWSLGRGAVYAVGFFVVMTAMGLTVSPLAVLAIPAAVLIGFAFAAVGMAATTFMKSWQDFDLVTLVTLPLFLFSATFYPLSVYPRPLQIFTQFSPLYHGVEIIRALTLDAVDWGILTHVAVLLGVGVSTPEHAVVAASAADGVIVGSALVRRLLEGGGPEQAGKFVASIRQALDDNGWQAGSIKVAFQSCDDATAQAGKWESGKCSQNGNAYAANDSVGSATSVADRGCALCHPQRGQRGGGGSAGKTTPGRGSSSARARALDTSRGPPTGCSRDTRSRPSRHPCLRARRATRG